MPGRTRAPRPDDVLGKLADEAGLVCVAQEDHLSEEDDDPTTDASDWVLVARRSLDLGPVAFDRQWHHCARSRGAAWTDDFSNLLRVLDLDG